MGTALIALAITACAPRSEAPQPVVLGAVYDLTGSQSSIDVPSMQGARLAVEEANAAGGVLGRPIRLETADGESDPELVLARTRSLLDDHPALAGVVGFSDTDMVLAAAPAVMAAQRPLVTSGATSPLLPGQVPHYLFLACFGDNVQAAAGAEWAFQELGTRSVVVLFDDTTDYTRLLHGYFESRFTSLGGEVLVSRPYRAEDPSAAVADLPTADLVYLAAPPAGAVDVVRGLRSGGVEAPILGGDGLDIGAGWRGVEEATDVYFTTHAYLGADNPNPRVSTFRQAYVGRFPGAVPDAFSALGYDATNLLVEAIRRAGIDEPEAVIAALAETNGFPGVTGVISYVGGSRIPQKSVTVLKVADGSEVFVTQVVPERVPEP